MKAAIMMAAVTLCASVSGPAVAADLDYPKGPVHLVVPFPPGGPTDTLARILADGLQDRWKQPVIVENKPGAGTVIGIDHVAKAKPDGQTIGIVISAFTINPSIRKSMPYDTLRDLQGITQLADSRVALVARTDAPFRSVRELIEHAKASPGKLTYASPGAGTSTHLAGELFKETAGIDMVHVPYKGSSAAQTDLIGGQVDVMFDLAQSAMPMVKAGRLKFLALASDKPDPAFPGVPTVAESVPGYTVGSMFGLVTAAAVSRATVDAIREASIQVMRAPKAAAAMKEMGLVSVASSPDDFRRFLAQEIAKWRRVVEDNNLSME